MNAGIFLFSFAELFADANLVIKLFAFITIIAWIKNHIQGPGALALMAGVSWFVLFDAWKFFGGIYVLWMLLMLGLSNIVIDFFFVSQMGSGGGMDQAANPSPISSGNQLAQRAQAQQAKMAGGRPPMPG